MWHSMPVRTSTSPLPAGPSVASGRCSCRPRPRTCTALGRRAGGWRLQQSRAICAVSVPVPISGCYCLCLLGGGVPTACIFEYVTTPPGGDDIAGVALPPPLASATLGEGDHHDVFNIVLNAGNALEVTLIGDTGTDFALSLSAPGSPGNATGWCVASSSGSSLRLLQPAPGGRRDFPQQGRRGCADCRPLRPCLTSPYGSVASDRRCCPPCPGSRPATPCRKRASWAPQRARRHSPPAPSTRQGWAPQWC